MRLASTNAKIMQRTKLFLSTICIVLSLILNSCGALVKGKANKYATVEQGAIPQEFGQDNITLLFITKGKRSYDKYLKRNVKKAYHGKYKFISITDLSSDSYSNLDEYPYYFDFQAKQYQSYSQNEVIHGPGGGFKRSTVRKFAIHDRRTNTTYPIKMTSGYWSKLQRVYIKNMEAQRLKNTPTAANVSE